MITIINDSNLPLCMVQSLERLCSESWGNKNYCFLSSDVHRIISSCCRDNVDEAILCYIYNFDGAVHIHAIQNLQRYLNYAYDDDDLAQIQFILLHNLKCGLKHLVKLIKRRHKKSAKNKKSSKS